jgi:phenylacetate-CoA ligase
MLFAKDKFAHALTWTIIKNRYSWYGIKLSSNQARFYGIPLSKWKYLKERIKDYFMNRFRFVVFDLSDKNLKRFENKFRKRKFDFIYGYTNSMVVFAKYLINKNLILSKHVCPTLKSCIVTSEQCSELDQNILEKGFGVNVIKEYGASELDFIAFTNADGVWTISNELVYVEIIGDNGLPLPDGEVGKIVVTSLHNRAMPFIRYEIGDLGSIKHNVLKKHDQLLTLNGRLNDFAILPSGKRVPGFTLYYVSRQILEDTGLVKEYVIRQITKFDFVFEIVSDRTISKKDEELIIKIMENYLEPGLNIVINKVEEINRDKSGKLKHFVSFVKE